MSDLIDESARDRTGRLLQDAQNAAALPHRLALLDIESKQIIASHRSHYDPNQPRVPAGHSDGGQWTSGGAGAGARIAAGEGRGGRGGWFGLLLHLALLVIEAYRSREKLWNLFGEKDGTVAWTKFKGKDIFGTNSESPAYESTDRAAAEKMRGTLLEKYPELMNTKEIGKMPNNALFHAETTVLMRAAHENGGILAGQTMVIVSDGQLCNNCRIVLPKVGLELGNPTVTFIDYKGRTLTMRDGRWAQ